MPAIEQRGSRWLVAGLVAASLVVDTAVLTAETFAGAGVPPSSKMWQSLLDQAVTAMMFSQVAVVALWLAWGRRFLVLRMLGTCTAPFVLNALAQLVDLLPVGTPYADYSMELVTFLEGFALVAVVAAVCPRLCGFRLQRFAPEGLAADELPTAAVSLRDHRFSLGTLFAWTTVAAVFCGLVRFAHHGLPWGDILDFLRNGDPADLVLVASFAVAPIAIAWAAFSPRRAARRLLLAILISPATLVAYGLLSGEPVTDRFAWIALFDAFTIVPLLIIRTAGYRLLWRRVRLGSVSAPANESLSAKAPLSPRKSIDRGAAFAET
jgi:hypothetical protein